MYSPQPHLGQLYEQYEAAVKGNIVTYSMKSFFIEGFVILKYVLIFALHICLSLTSIFLIS